MKYCTKCLYPETKPDLWFNDEGVCSACLAYEARKDKDWDMWHLEFHRQIQMANGKSRYNCIVPVSGGKDSTYQLVKIKELGYKPLAVCAMTDDLSSIGRANLNNIEHGIGVPLLRVSPDYGVRAKLAKYTLETIGDISWAEHVSIFTVPFRIALEMDIRLIVYGENPQNEYGGPEGTESVFKLDYNWLQEFGGLNGLRVDDIITAGIATKQEMQGYFMPDLKLLEKAGINAIFLGQFFPWDAQQNVKIAEENGFIRSLYPVEGNGSNYENLDNYQTGIHDYFKYLKFGFGRATDIANNELRRGRLTRAQAKLHILMYDGAYPITYLGQSLMYTLKKIGLDERKFDQICHKFTNKELFLDVPHKSPYPKFLGDLKNA